MSSITLYFIRHGLAGERGNYANDDDRPLTDEGQKKTRQVAKRLLELGLKFDPILSSPLVRARQTADILLEVGLATQLEEVGCLSPGGDLNAWLDWFQSWESPSDACLALVGHEPDLSEWAETLIFGRPVGALTLKKAGVIGLALPENESPIANSSLFWLTPPRFLLEKD